MYIILLVSYERYGGCGEAVNTPDCGSGISWVRSPSAAPFENNSGLPEFLFYLNPFENNSGLPEFLFYLNPFENNSGLPEFLFYLNIGTVFSYSSFFNIM